MLGDINFILVDVILPVLLIAAVGAVAHWKLNLDLPSLAKLNIYVLVPAFLFLYIFKSNLSFAAAFDIVWLIALPSLIVGVLAWIALKFAKTDRQRTTTILIAGLIFNAGNFGIPVAILRHGEPGAEVQAIVVMISNVSIWWIGYSILAVGHKGEWKAMLGFFRLPMIYALAAAVGLRMMGVRELPPWLHFPINALAMSLIPLALIVLGAQLVERIRWPNWGIVGPVLFIKLIALPAVTAVVVYFMGYWPWPGAQLVLAAAAPTAVNTLLLTMEFDGDAEAAADCVAWTTLISSITVAVALVLIAACGGHPPDFTAAIEP